MPLNILFTYIITTNRYIYREHSYSVEVRIRSLMPDRCTCIWSPDPISNAGLTYLYRIRCNMPDRRTCTYCAQVEVPVPDSMWYAEPMYVYRRKPRNLYRRKLMILVDELFLHRMDSNYIYVMYKIYIKYRMLASACTLQGTDCGQKYS